MVMVKFLNRAHRNPGCKGWQSILSKRGAAITPSRTSEGGFHLNLWPRCWCSGSTSSGEQTAKANVGLWQRSWHHRLRVKQINTPGCESGEQMQYLSPETQVTLPWELSQHLETIQGDRTTWATPKPSLVLFALCLRELCRLVKLTLWDTNTSSDTQQKEGDSISLI